MRIPRTIRKTWCISLIIVVSIALLAGVSSLLVRRHHQAAIKQAGAAIIYSADKPSEKKPTSSNYTWVGQPNDPKQLLLPTIHTTGYIQKVGVDQHNQVAVPNNIFLGGWFVNSARPGQAGLSIIDGHVDGVSQPGIFDRLAKLQPDAEFSLELGDGSQLHYKVLAIRSLPVASANSTLFSQDPKIASQLNLITCGGVFNRQQHAYDNRVIVSAALL